MEEYGWPDNSNSQPPQVETWYILAGYSLTEAFEGLEEAWHIK